MADLKALREELRNLRKDAVKPVSRMRKGDIAQEIERLKNKREETPPVASTKGASVKASKAAVETIKEAKASEFPIAPVEKKKVSSKSPKKLPVESVTHSAPAPVKGGKTKSSKMAKMMKLMEMMDAESGSDEE